MVEWAGSGSQQQCGGRQHHGRGGGVDAVSGGLRASTEQHDHRVPDRNEREDENKPAEQRGGTGGEYDENWPDWYAAYMVAEQAGTELPT